MVATVDQAAEWIAGGYIVIAPLEHGYVYLVDAFSHDAVQSMHVLRGDAPGITAQVLVGSVKTAMGIVREISDEAKSLMNQYWPGLLTLNLLPQLGLSWDLGDDRKLDTVSVRVPQAKFLLELLAKTGPLACASVAKPGNPPVLSIAQMEVAQSMFLRICDLGDLTAGPSSTVVSITKTATTMVREGAICFDDLLAHCPEITVVQSANS